MALAVRVAALGQEDRGERERRDTDRHVHEEDPLPGEEVGQDPAHQDARGGADAADRAPRAERDVAVAPFVERRRQDRERRRRDRRGAEALQRPGGDERRVAPGEAAEERADGEDDEPRHEDAAPAEDVGQAAAEQEEPPEHERVGADDPLQVLLREVEVGLDRRQRDVHDRDVENDHELHHAEQRECVPPSPIVGLCGRRVAHVLFSSRDLSMMTNERPPERHPGGDGGLKEVSDTRWGRRANRGPAPPVSAVRRRCGRARGRRRPPPGRARRRGAAPARATRRTRRRRARP